MLNTQYKNHTIVVNGRDFDITIGKHTLACGINDSPLERAKTLVDIEFNTDDLRMILSLPKTTK